MPNVLNQLFLIAIIFFITSCDSFYNNNQQAKLRIVDLNGKPHQIQMRTPELNMQALAAQGNLSEEKIKSQPRDVDKYQEIAAASNKYGNSDFNASSAEAIQNTSQLPSQQTRLVETPTSATESDTLVAGEKIKTKDQVIEYNLDGSQENTKTQTLAKEEPKTDENADPKPASKDSLITKNQKGIFVQAGSFSVMQHAKNSVAKIEKFASKSYPASIEEALHNEKTIYRVLIGPFSSKQKAMATIAKLTKSGHQAIIVKR